MEDQRRRERGRLGNALTKARLIPLWLAMLVLILGLAFQSRVPSHWLQLESQIAETELIVTTIEDPAARVDTEQALQSAKMQRAALRKVFPELPELTPEQREHVTTLSVEVKVPVIEVPVKLARVHGALEDAANDIVPRVKLVPGLTAEQQRMRAVDELMAALELIEAHFDLVPQWIVWPVFTLLRRGVGGIVDAAFERQAVTPD